MFGNSGEENVGGGDNYDESWSDTFQPGKANGVAVHYYINDREFTTNNLHSESAQKATDTRFEAVFVPSDEELHFKRTTLRFSVNNGKFGWGWNK